MKYALSSLVLVREKLRSTVLCNLPRATELESGQGPKLRKSSRVGYTLPSKATMAFWTCNLPIGLQQGFPFSGKLSLSLFMEIACEYRIRMIFLRKLPKFILLTQGNLFFNKPFLLYGYCTYQYPNTSLSMKNTHQCVCCYYVSITL